MIIPHLREKGRATEIVPHKKTLILFYRCIALSHSHWPTISAYPTQKLVKKRSAPMSEK